MKRDDLLERCDLAREHDSFMKHLPEILQRLLSFWTYLTTFAVLFSGVCCRFCVLWKHLPEIFRQMFPFGALGLVVTRAFC